MIRIGTSGYSFTDWQGTFYPRWIKQAQYFEYYAQFFDAVEINLTFYTIPSYDFFESLSRRSNKDFAFTVKLPSPLTHEQNLSQMVVDKFKHTISPIVEDNKLKALLAQFPYSFRFNDENLNYIRKLRDAFAPLPLFVEFRRNDWDNHKLYEFLEQEHIGLVYPDLPGLDELFKPSTIPANEIAYFRFHGRNRHNWWKSSEKERYDYDYSKDELLSLVQMLKASEKKSRMVFGFFNNCFLGRAARNALTALKILGVEKEQRGLFDI